MSNAHVHTAFHAALAGIAPPPALNDDDLYIVDLRRLKIVKQMGSASADTEIAKQFGYVVYHGQALLTGMQARAVLFPAEQRRDEP